MTGKSWYAMQAKAVPARYGLSKNIQTLLQALENYHKGYIDAAELGRLVRLSPKRRSAVADTITKCANKIKKQPDEVQTCVEIIEMCTEILEVADRKPEVEVFPLAKLPLEVRSMILGHMVDQVFTTKAVRVGRRQTCGCPGPIFRGEPKMKDLPLALGPGFQAEFLRVLFRRRMFKFQCACELRVCLSNNDLLRRNIRNIVVHWTGPHSDTAFQSMSECPNLDRLTIRVSKSTLTYRNKQADDMSVYFPIPFRNARLSDALGLDELLMLRGMREVYVSHIEGRMSERITEMERAGLGELLRDKIQRPKE